VQEHSEQIVCGGNDGIVTTFLVWRASPGSAPLVPWVLLEPVPTTFRLSVRATFSALFALGLPRWRVTHRRLGHPVGETCWWGPLRRGGVCRRPGVPRRLAGG